jgi:hypothetical protein
MITAPVIHELGRPPSGEDRTSRLPFVLKLPGRPELLLEAGSDAFTGGRVAWP